MVSVEDEAAYVSDRRSLDWFRGQKEVDGEIWVTLEEKDMDRKSVRLVAGCLATAIGLSSCMFSPTITVRRDTREVVLPKCTPIIRYTAESLSIKGVDIPIPKVPVKIGELVWKPEVLQHASKITQILENHRMTVCQQLPVLATGASENVFQKALAEMQDDEYRITTLALLVAANNPKAVEEWVATYFARANALTIRAETGKFPEAAGDIDVLVRTGKLLRSE